MVDVMLLCCLFRKFSFGFERTEFHDVTNLQTLSVLLLLLFFNRHDVTKTAMTSQLDNTLCILLLLLFFNRHDVTKTAMTSQLTNPPYTAPSSLF